MFKKIEKLINIIREEIETIKKIENSTDEKYNI